MLLKEVKKRSFKIPELVFGHQIINTFNDGIVILDENNDIILCNEGFEQIFGAMSKDIVGKNVVQFHQNRQQNRVGQALENLKNNPEGLTKRIIHVEDQIIECIYSSIIGADNKYRGIIAKFRDITREKHIEQKNINLHKMYRLIFNTTTDALITINQEGLITTCNRSARKFFGGNEEPTGKTVIDLLYQGKKYDCRGNYTCLMMETLETGTEHRNKEQVFIVNNQEHVFLVDTCLLRNEDNQVIGVLGAIRDITKKKAEDEEHFRQDKFELVNQVAYGLAHEIRNPLTSVRGFIQLLHQNLRKSQQRNYLQVALEELDRVNSLIKDFLLLSRPGAPHFSLVSFDQIISDLVPEISQLARNKGLTFEVISEVSFPLVFLDKEQISRALYNILQNAVQFTDEGQITLRLKNDVTREKLVIEIVDSGQGIPKENLSQIFEPFFTTKEEAPGFGLAISYRIIKNHGGSLCAKNNREKGTTFFIELPHVSFYPG